MRHVIRQFTLRASTHSVTASLEQQRDCLLINVFHCFPLFFITLTLNMLHMEVIVQVGSYEVLCSRLLSAGPPL